jgi:hypothetical protein
VALQGLEKNHIAKQLTRDNVLMSKNHNPNGESQRNVINRCYATNPCSNIVLDAGVPLQRNNTSRQNEESHNRLCSKTEKHIDQWVLGNSICFGIEVIEKYGQRKNRPHHFEAD